MQKECPVCNGEGRLCNYGCGEYGCCGPRFDDCYKCDGEGTVTIDDEEEAS